MKLWNDSYQAILQGTKTIEMRLNDPKRRKIKKGDIIVFENTTTKQNMNCVVLNIASYMDFKELYQNYLPTALGYSVGEVADEKDMYAYYSKEDIALYGVLAIEICPIYKITPDLLSKNGLTLSSLELEE